MTISSSEWQASVRRLQWHLFVRDVEPERSALLGHCRRLTGNSFDADDLVHDTLLIAFSWLGRLWTGIDHPRAFLFRIARNQWVDRLRRERGAHEPPTRATAGPESAVELDRVLSEAKRVMPAAEFSAWFACVVCGFSSEEAGRALGRSTAAIKMARSRGGRRLERIWSVGESGKPTA